MQAYGTFTEEIQASGKLVAGDALQPTSTATSIRVRDGETLTTDGPFAETKEILGGYYLIDVDTLDEALEWARQDPRRDVRDDRGAPGRDRLRNDVGIEELVRAYRDERARSIAILGRVLGDLDLAEDAVQDAFVRAAERWPRDGVPANPGAWIVATARNRGDRPDPPRADARAQDGAAGPRRAASR